LFKKNTAFTDESHRGTYGGRWDLFKTESTEATQTEVDKAIEELEEEDTDTDGIIISEV